MALVINRNNLNQWVDFTDVLAEVPKANYLLNDLGVFTPEYSSQKTIEIRQKVGNAHVLEDRNWDERNQTIAGGEVRSLQLKIPHLDRKSTRLNSSHVKISYAVFCLKKKTIQIDSKNRR